MDDLFSNFRTETKPKSSRKDSFEGIFISPEMFIGAVIIFIIAIVLSFSIGVEQGKHIARSQVVLRRDKKGEETAGKKERFGSSKGEKFRKVSAKTTSRVKRKIETKQEKIRKKGGRYAVQLVVYKDSRYAQREMDYLKKQKYPFFKEVKGGKITISAGPFSTMDEAKKAEKILKRRYRDCFIKLIKR